MWILEFIQALINFWGKTFAFFSGLDPFCISHGATIDETPMRPGRGSYVTDEKQHLSALKISFPWETYSKACV